MAKAATTEKPAANRQTRRAAAATERRDAVNHARGQRTLTVLGKTYKLALTMGAMSEIEDALGVDDMAGVEASLATAGSRKYAHVIVALINAGEDRADAVTVEEVRKWPMTIGQLSTAIVLAFNGAGAMTDEEAAAEGK